MTAVPPSDAPGDQLQLIYEAVVRIGSTYRLNGGSGKVRRTAPSSVGETSELPMMLIAIT